MVKGLLLRIRLALHCARFLSAFGVVRSGFEAGLELGALRWGGKVLVCSV
jgi:hypothetical protein